MPPILLSVIIMGDSHIENSALNVNARLEEGVR